MTGKTVVPEEAVEAAARAWLERSTKPGSWTLEGSVRAALEAATPFIAAKALEEAAEELDLPGSDATGYYAYEQESGYREAERHTETWLTNRAAAVRGEG